MTKFEAIGLALNNIFPLRLGEIVRVSFAAAKLKAPFFTVFATVMVERIMDLIILVILFLVSVRFGTISWLKQNNVIIMTAFVLALAALTLLIFMEDIITKNKLFSFALGKFPKIKQFLCRISAGAQSFKNKKLILPIIASSFCLWLSDALIFWLAAADLKIKPVISFGKAIVLLCAGAVAGMIPAMPGYFGTFETAIQQTLIGWKVSKSAALGYGGFVHMVFYSVMTVMGLIFLYRTGSGLGLIWKKFSGKKTK
jgi:uncharacterized protein (TIRG00374 family)